MRGKLYLFGGSSCPDATECLPGVYSFDIGKDAAEGGGREDADGFHPTCFFFLTAASLVLAFSDQLLVRQQCLLPGIASQSVA